MGAARGAVVLDSSPVLDFLLGEPGAGAVADLLRTGTTRMSTVNLAEVVDVLVRVYGVAADAAAMQVGELVAEVVEPAVPDVGNALRAGQLRAGAFHRRKARISLADCFVLAACRDGDRVLTSDQALALLARAEGLDVVEPLS